ncbi:MAG TPA: 4'-phosphopantetheinyl transferase superfamily protein [Ignavibacteriales bacterium]|nr:4'-phosphopantetheinyl transferase superfamily protein [Ignavibacteriales bacterium]
MSENNKQIKTEYLLPEDEIHVWHVKAESASAAEFWDILTRDEMERACAYYFSKDRDNFIISRGVLRILIARYLNILPEEITLHFNKYGKPFLKKNGKELKFNVSHSKGMLLFAFSRGLELGIDIEFMRHDFAHMEIAGGFFSKNEVLMLSLLPEEMRTTAFYNCWTRKEAFIKAKGRGLSIPLDSFDVSVRPGDPPELLNIYGQAGESRKWKIFNLNTAHGYCASLAVRGNPREIKHFDCADEFLHNHSLFRRPLSGLRKKNNPI